jgi:hypothetical protein
MKTHLSLTFRPLSLLASLALLSPVAGATLSWDNAAATNVWNTTDLNWTGGAWTNGDNAEFGHTATPSTITLANGLTVIGTGGGGFIGAELVPVPESSAVLTALLLASAVGYRERRHFLHRR